ncbi:GlsB/YeaQ/YmgE family stress response membrane protein [Bacillus mangrovi]|uniref:GlsB/YeaQ/YmgE family stress response membrane protein n=1 Tax=Metabacillus mangrovi TaxID=1491830 RepID=A0A7X2V702_9BACI|nr:GlsB/YeaQ/YmgE family stress response membrane protein [Metabacillus mangrovi]MTH55604.1 GlsB/YeaQ/YmgE family stress response membrane protein [Metabacillus mangrovi]
MNFLISILVALVIGWVGDMLVKGSMPGGIIGSIIAGFAGAWLGHGLFGTWGPKIQEFAIIPAIIGAAIVVFIVQLVMKKMGGSKNRAAHR